MPSLKEACASAASRFRIYRPARGLYRIFFGAEGRQKRARLARFYRDLLPADAIVFDIGAHEGIYSEVFASLSARVIAVEPNPGLATRIRRSNPGSKVTVIEAAAGPLLGRGKLRLCSASQMSSMSLEWIEIVKRTERLKNCAWNEEIDVAIVTIDFLFSKFGSPYFVKIDVEGFEEQVLSGMSEQPALLSFEFNPEAMEACARCLQKFSSGSVFNFAVGQPERFELEQWLVKSDFMSQLSLLEEHGTYGDVFVKRE